MPGSNRPDVEADKLTSGVDLLDGQLNRLDETINLLRDRLVFVLLYSDPEATLATPVAMPRSGIVERAQRLDDLVSSLDEIISRIDL